ncbi:hypothetical protein HK104_001763 [Borealophlyctis nickersoniae]|nr:hypothetical protein HK104_001763 [Borealophlyctis nickersoniae]
MTDTNNTPKPLLNLPTEILYSVLEFLITDELPYALVTFGRASRKCRVLAGDDILWDKVFLARFDIPRDPSTTPNLKSLYIDRVQALQLISRQKDVVDSSLEAQVSLDLQLSVCTSMLRDNDTKNLEQIRKASVLDYTISHLERILTSIPFLQNSSDLSLVEVATALFSQALAEPGTRLSGRAENFLRDCVFPYIMQVTEDEFASAEGSLGHLLAAYLTHLGKDALDDFLVDGRIVRSTGKVFFQKWYVNKPDSWVYQGTVLPYGIAGMYGDAQFGGPFWIWKVPMVDSRESGTR